VLFRSKNNFIFYNNLVKIVGNTYEHKVLYSSIKRTFFLERIVTSVGTSKDYYLAINIDPPIRQGQTRYNFIVMAVSEGVEGEYTLNIGETEKREFPELKDEYVGDVLFSFLSVLKTLSKCKIIKTGNFSTLAGRKCVKCSLKATDGHLYPLNDSLLFLPKAIYMPLKDVSCVEFSRINVSSFAAKTFDMKIVTIDKVYAFSSLPKEDFGQLEQYFSEHGVQVRSEIVEDEVSEYSAEGEEEDSSDVISSDESEQESDQDSS
jgi:structure-specific recognition protein 1